MERESSKHHSSIYIIAIHKQYIHIYSKQTYNRVQNLRSEPMNIKIRELNFYMFIFISIKEVMAFCISWIISFKVGTCESSIRHFRTIVDKCTWIVNKLFTSFYSKIYNDKKKFKKKECTYKLQQELEYKKRNNNNKSSENEKITVLSIFFLDLLYCKYKCKILIKRTFNEQLFSFSLLVGLLFFSVMSSKHHHFILFRNEILLLLNFPLIITIILSLSLKMTIVYLDSIIA